MLSLAVVANELCRVSMDCRLFDNLTILVSATSSLSRIEWKVSWVLLLLIIFFFSHFIQPRLHNAHQLTTKWIIIFLVNELQLMCHIHSYVYGVQCLAFVIAFMFGNIGAETTIMLAHFSLCHDLHNSVSVWVPYKIEIIAPAASRAVNDNTLNPGCSSLTFKVSSSV